MEQLLFKSNHVFQLESGQTLPALQLAYHTYGKLNKDKSNVVWVCHALTANSNVFEWWPDLFGENDLFNPNDHFIVCVNNLGSCYGSTGALSINPYNNQPWYSYFPNITIKDMANALDLLRIKLGIEKIHTIIGGSQGAQIVLEWNVKQPNLFQHTIITATNAVHSAWGIAFNESQRLAIKADRTYYAHTPDGGKKGLAAARSIALLSYRNYNTYNTSQTETASDKTDNFNAASYQRYQGEKLVNRFDAYTYVVLANAMDSHNLGRGSISIENALQQITANTLVIGISSDLLFPVHEQKFIAQHVKKSEYHEIDSLYGHDGFLIETKKIAEVIKQFYSNVNLTNKTTNNLIEA